MLQIRPRWSIPRVMLRWRSIINFSTVMLFPFLFFFFFIFFATTIISLLSYLFIKSSVRSLEWFFFFYLFVFESSFSRIRCLIAFGCIDSREAVVSRMTSVPLSLWFDVLFCIGEVVSIDVVLKNICECVYSMMWSVEIFLFLSGLFYK